MERDFNNPVKSGSGADTTDSVTPPKKTDTVTAPIPPKDTLVKPIPPKDTLVKPIPPKDTLVKPIPPKDTVVTPSAIAVTGIQAEAVFIPMGVVKARPSVNLLPRNAQNQGYTLMSLDESIAVVSGPDLIPVKPGAVSIRARSDDGGFTVEFQASVILKDTNRYEEAVATAAMELVAGGATQAPEIVWTPADVTNRAYSMTSSDPARVLVVMEDGVPKCKPLAAGAAEMTIRTLGKGLTATFKVVVNPAPILTVPVLAISAENMTMDLGTVDQPPMVTYTPALATQKAYQLVSGNPSVVTVSGPNLHAEAGGTAVVSITSVDGPSGQFQVMVRVRVRAVSAPNLVLIEGQKHIAAVTFVPANPDQMAFSLSSSNAETVSVSGAEVTAKKPGSVTITITAADGGVTGLFTVKVNKSQKDND